MFNKFKGNRKEPWTFDPIPLFNINFTLSTQPFSTAPIKTSLGRILTPCFFNHSIVSIEQFPNDKYPFPNKYTVPWSIGHLFLLSHFKTSNEPLLIAALEISQFFNKNPFPNLQLILTYLNDQLDSCAPLNTPSFQCYSPHQLPFRRLDDCHQLRIPFVENCWSLCFSQLKSVLSIDWLDNFTMQGTQ